MYIKPNYLTHWTGKDICTDLDIMTDSNRTEYINRFIETIKSGLWMTQIEDEFSSFGKNGDLKVSGSYVTCFTELKLTLSLNHVKKYGLMGFSFNPEFVLKRGGAPVHYYQCGENDFNLEVFKDILVFLGKNANTSEDFQKHFQESKIIASLMKPMYYPNNDINNMEESEWRIVQHLGILDYLQKTNINLPKYKIPFNSNDLKMIILPDNLTKEFFLDHNDILKWLESTKYKSTILTFEDLVLY